MAESERRLAAIMFTDMVGYTALGQRNESLSLALLEEQRKLIRPILGRHSGREIKTIGDAFLVEFLNALDAVRCAYDIQRAAREFNFSLPSEERIHLRVGLHLGEVVESQNDISGDAVNVASRIESLAEDGGVCLTRQVYDHVHNKFELPMRSLGQRTLKNVNEQLEVYKVVMPWEQSSREGASSFPANRIAILPFISFSADPNDEYFAEGVTEEIISTVSGISGLNVISRTSVMGYKGTTKNVRQIGSELEVGTVLEGTFRKAGNRIRVTTQLIDVANDKHLWSQNYDRTVDDVFAVQSDVARQVAEALRVEMRSPELERIQRKPTESTAAYTLYLKGRYLWNRRGLDDLKKAIEYFELAIHEDPNFALGFAGLADCYLMLRSDWGVDLEKNLEKAKSMVAKVLELNPESAEAHATRGMILTWERDFHLAEEEFRRAIELKPSYATAHHWYMWALCPQLRWDEALEQIEKAVELDPLSPIINDNLGLFYLWKRDYPRAIGPFKRAIELGMKSSHGNLASTYGMMGMYEEMLREAPILIELLQPSAPLAKAMVDTYAAYYEGDKETVRRLLPTVEIHLQDANLTAFEIALFYFFLGEDEKGFEWLDRSFSRKEHLLPTLTFDPMLDRVRGDPRYLDLVKRLGLG